VSSVHIGASLPIGGGLLDRDGRLLSDRRVRVSDASAMPELPWVNPGGPLSVLALLLARRAEASAAQSRSIL
jgi:choline dehydrogenase-like flavoprotein